MNTKNTPSTETNSKYINIALTLVSLLTVYFTTLFVLGTTLNF